MLSDSVDGRHSMLVASDVPSDQTFEFECGPCKSDDKIRDAGYYCYTCSEYLCNDCWSHHRKFKEMRNHKIVYGSEIPKHSLDKQSVVPGVKCGCNQNFVETFCEDHDDVICGACHTVKHRKCKTIAILNKCSQFRGYQPGSVLKKAKSLETYIESLKRTRETEIRSVEKMTEEGRSQIGTYCDKLTELLDKMKRNLLKDIDAVKTEHNQTVDHQISSLTTTLQLLNGDCKTLEDLAKNGTKEAIFAMEIKILKSLKVYETVMLDIAKEVKKCSISFEDNTQLEALLKETNLGNLKISELPVILDMKKVSSTNANVKLPDDENTPSILGCAFLPNGKLLLTDNANHKVKLLDSSFAVEDSLVLPSAPVDITALDDGTAIVALPWEHRLKYIHITPKLKLGRTVPVDGYCYSVAVISDELFVGCRKDDKSDIRVLGKDGNEKIRVDVKKGLFGSRLFKCPLYITTNMSHTKIFVSDHFTDMVSCLTTDGTIIYQYKEGSMRGPRGLYVDAEDNLLVCSYHDDEIQVITGDGKKYKTLLSSKGDLYRPRSIDVRPIDNTLVVGCNNKDHLFISQVA